MYLQCTFVNIANRTKDTDFQLQTPSRLEPVLADKEVILACLNIKSMAFSNSDYESQVGSDGGEGDTPNTLSTAIDVKAPL